MSMNWGGFGGGFAQGFRSGTEIGNSITTAIKQKKINDVREQGMAEAQAARDAAIASQVKDTQQAAADASQAASQPVQPEAEPRAGQVMPNTPEMQTSPVPMPPSQQQMAAPASAGFAPAVRPPGQPVEAPAEAPQAAPPTAPAAPGAMPPPAADGMKKRFMVGDAGFDSHEEAMAHAKKSAPSEMDFFIKNAVPRISQAYLEQGDVDKAEAWDKYAKDKATQKNMDTWAKMARSAQSGDFDSAANHAFELYKSYDDGVTPVSKETVKDKDGNVTGFNVKLKSDTTGETRSQFIGTKEIVEMGLSALSPPSMFEQMYKRQSSADAMSAKARIDAQNDARTAARQEATDIRREGREAKRAEAQHGYKLEELTTAEGLKQAGIGKAEKAKVQAKVDILRDNGLSPDAIREIIPHMLGGDGYKKSTSPEEARRMLMTEHAKDPLFGSKPADKQRAIIDQEMDVIYGGQKAKPAAPAQPAAPSPAAPAGGAKKGVPVWDSKTGTIVYR